MTKKLFFNTPEKKGIAIFGDLFIILFALVLLNRKGLDHKFSSTLSEMSFYLAGSVFFFLLAYTLDFYNFNRFIRYRMIFRQCMYIVGIYVSVVVLGLLFLYDMSFWRSTLFVFFFGTPLAILIWRMFYRDVFRALPAIKKVLFIYDQETERHAGKAVSKVNGNEMPTGYEVAQTLRLGEAPNDQITGFDNLTEVDAIILDVKDYATISASIEKFVLEQMVEGKEVLSYVSFYEMVYEALPVESHSESFYEILRLKGKKVRYFDNLFTIGVNVFLSIVVGGVFLLAIPCIWLGNFFGNNGPLFYRQKRVGKRGKEFILYKFRSMVVDAERHGAQMAVANDTRVTSFGKILRRTRIDELPQIISVILGDMSFIGPRPERKLFADRLNQMLPYYNVRHLSKPGITGWAQVKYKYGETLKDSIMKLEYDLFYIKNRSISLDLKIIIKTINTVIFSKGQ